MMTLAEASSYFDRTQVYDAYSGAPLFLAQIEPFSDSLRDAMAAYRRILSIAPGIVLPAHKTLRIFDETWIASAEPEIDGLEDKYRSKYVLQSTPVAFNVGTISEFLDGSAPTVVYGFASWIKDSKEISENSAISSVFDIMLAPGTAVVPHQIIWAGGLAYLAMSVRSVSSGFVSVSVLRLDQHEPMDAEVTSRTYSPAAGNYTAGSTDYPYALRVRWESLFAYDEQMDARHRPGDFTLAFDEDVAISTACTVQFDGMRLAVLSVKAIHGAVIAHVRRA